MHNKPSNGIQMVFCCTESLILHPPLNSILTIIPMDYALCMSTCQVLHLLIIISYLVKEILLYRSNKIVGNALSLFQHCLIFLQGYSSLAVALALPESGRLVACERDERCLEVAKRYYQLAGVAHKVIIFSLLLDIIRS